MSKVCELCRIDTKRAAQCIDGQRQYYVCVDEEPCRKRVRDKETQKRNEAKQRRDREFEEKHGNIDPDDLIEVGVMYRDATTYYYHEASDTLFGQRFGSEEFERRDGGISDYERGYINRALMAQ